MQSYDRLEGPQLRALAEYLEFTEVTAGVLAARRR